MVAIASLGEEVAKEIAAESTDPSDDRASDSGSSIAGAGAAGGLPSVGSALHASGRCSRCCFFLKDRCRNGVNCQFCHLPHERRSRGRGCRGHGSSRHMEMHEDVSQQNWPATLLAGLVPVPPGLAMLPPVDGPLSPEDARIAGRLGSAFSQPPTPQGRSCTMSTTNAMPVRMASSLPATPQGLSSKCFQNASNAPPFSPPSKPPSGLPENADQALLPPPPQNSPGSPRSVPITAAAANAMVAARILDRLTVTPSIGQRGSLLSTAPPADMNQRMDAGKGRCGPPGTFIRPQGLQAGLSPAKSMLEHHSSMQSPCAQGPILGTTPSPPAVPLPRLLGSRGPPPGLFHSVKEQSRVVEPKLQGHDESSVSQAQHGELHSGSSKPLKVFMPDYECEVPSLNPLMPCKKRVPVWML
eukprot:TRINITY_DN57181_c0_g1_i1.p1 TRINITY_DN57181_c0_g1~~TRINITY_DN57181_c0_g1_i1.p1  ORF type:complete len:413 (-),score=69.49 TRINITY_DN57181_c0_g1_i1:183-1421(-)